METAAKSMDLLSKFSWSVLGRERSSTGRNEQNWERYSFPVLFLVPAVVGLVLAASMLQLIAKKTSRSRGRLPLPPGPRGVPFLGFLPYVEPDIHSWFARLSHKYGPIISLNLGQKLFVVVSSPSLAKEILKDQDATFANRDVPPGSLALLNGVHGMGWAPYGPQWRMLRRLCMGEMLNTSKLDISSDARRRAVRGMVAELHGGGSGGGGSADPVINLEKVLFSMMYKAITGMLWEATLSDEEKRRVRREFEKAMEYLAVVFCKPDLSDIFPILAPFDFQGIVRDTKKGGAVLEQILDSLIDQRLEKGNINVGSTRDFLQVLLQVKEKGDPKTPLTRSHVKGLIMDIVLAGHDTTWTTMEWIMTEAMKHPEVMKMAQEELDRVVGQNGVVEETHLPHLHYLKAMTKEVLRMHPVIPLMLPRTPSQSTSVGGYMVPKGSRVLVNVWAIQRDPEAWDSPDEFRPDRFLTAAGKVLEFSGNDLHYFPFGSGRRICPGMAFAEKMLMYTMATLLHSFDWKLPEGTKLDVSEKFGFVLKKAAPLVLVPIPRLSRPKLYMT